MEKDFKELCELVIKCSMRWSGNDEEKYPELKRLRTLAGYYIDRDNESICFDCGEQENLVVVHNGVALCGKCIVTENIKV